MKTFLLSILVLIALSIVWLGESRRFYCFDNDNYITVWKTYNNVCYIIPGKYYGLLKPSQCYIKSTNSNNMTIYMSNELPNSLIYRSDEAINVIGGNHSNFTFVDYNSNTNGFHSMLYETNSKLLKGVKGGVDYMDIFIKENYAIDKNGKHL